MIVTLLLDELHRGGFQKTDKKKGSNKLHLTKENIEKAVKITSQIVNADNGTLK